MYLCVSYNYSLGKIRRYKFFDTGEMRQKLNAQNILTMNKKVKVIFLI